MGPSIIRVGRRLTTIRERPRLDILRSVTRSPGGEVRPNVEVSVRSGIEAVITRTPWGEAMKIRGHWGEVITRKSGGEVVTRKSGGEARLTRRTRSEVSASRRLDPVDSLIRRAEGKAEVTPRPEDEVSNIVRPGNLITRP